MKKPIPLHDPCQLRSLPGYAAPDDLWSGIQAQLSTTESRQANHRPAWLALAASVLLGIFLVNQFYLQNPAEQPYQTDQGQVADNNVTSAKTTDPEYIPADSILIENQTERLLAMSQTLEDRIENYKFQNGPVSAREAIVIAELEDMIAVVDEQLGSQNADPELWYRRVTLLADLVAVYDQRRNRDYSQYVAL